MHKVGDIVLVPFPFTDLTGEKVRPALVLGVQTGDDVTVCFISSISQNKLHKFDVFINSADKSFKKSGLKLNSLIKVTKIATLDKVVILGKIGELDNSNITKVKSVLKNYFQL